MKTVNVQCPTCQKAMEVALPRQTVLVNDDTLSIGAVAHEKPITCPGCGQYFIFAASRVFFEWSIVPITDEEAARVSDKRIITPPAGSLELIG